MRKTGFAHTLRPRQEPGMVHPPGSRGIEECRDLIFLTEHCRGNGDHNKSPIAASNIPVTSSGAPLASTMRQRAGSASASVRNVPVTRR